jgi:AraC-like DNA-binding protein
MYYQTFKPNKDLETWVKCYWTLNSSVEDIFEKQTIVPDGCFEMIFHYGDLYKQYYDTGQHIIQPRCFIIGQLTKPLEIEPTGVTGIFAVRFHPNGFVPFTSTSISIKDLSNTAFDLSKVFGKEGEEIVQKVINAASTLERINCVESFLISKIINTQTIDRIVKSAVETIITANGQLSIQALSQKVDINRRQLERRFSSTIGLSPKQLSKVIRLQAAFKLLIDKKNTSLTDLAYEGEYYDQAHFIKDFKELTGVTPKEFYKDHLKMATLFIH